METKETGPKVAYPQGDRESEVRIHIDHKPYDSPNPTTGKALYTLGQIVEDLVLLRQVQCGGEVIEIPNSTDVIELRPGEQFHTGPREKTETTIIVNGRQRSVSQKHLSFLEVVALAFDPIPTGPNLIFTITYWHGPRPNPEGTLLEGSKVRIAEGMVFNVTQTDKS
ncbi:MAG: hypothetical protein AMXMBFR82_06830 [Candidatus Hydrogenedentota bacterium]